MLGRQISGCVVVLVSLTFSSLAMSGDVCVNCHTMHASQDGGAMGTGPNPQLLLYSTCIACHTGTNNGTTEIHHVLTSSDPTNTQLAGGNFYWTEQGATNAYDRLAHNVSGLTVNNADGLLGDTPPGGSALTGNITCAGTTGCHGNRTNSDEFLDLDGAHHNNSTDQITVAEAQAAATANEPGQAYRFLDGVAGYEDNDREYETSTDHNTYYGDIRSNDSVADTNTISYLCSTCHDDFHNDSGGEAVGAGTNNFATPWLRHPTDYKMSVTGSDEYSGYSTYDPDVPVARSSVLNNANNNTVNDTVGTDAIVMCLSCHRAHGSPYRSIMRWNYRDWPNDLTQDGCLMCHTTKD